MIIVIYFPRQKKTWPLFMLKHMDSKHFKFAILNFSVWASLVKTFTYIFFY